MRILIADDNATNRKLLRVVLEAEGATVREVADGVEALSALGEAPADVIISDVFMPNKDGYELCHAVRRHPAWRALPFIFYTNTHTSGSSEKLAYEFGADGFIRKPATAEAILETLQRVIAWRETAAAGAPPCSITNDPGPAGAANHGPAAPHAALENTRAALLRINHRLLQRTRALETAEAALREANERLEARVRERTQALKLANRELESANRELEAFSAAVSHDLASPLTGIRVGCGLLATDDQTRLSPTARQNVAQMDRSAERIHQIVTALLGLSRLSHGEPARAAVDVSACAAEIAADLQRTGGRAVECRIAAGLRAHGDPHLLRIALANLLGNAWKYTGRRPDAMIEVGTATWPGEAAPVFFVRDNGAGFEPESAARLFQPFQRLHAAAEFPGTGIGLWTVQRIVRRHGGRLWAESRPGEGATFFFNLPGPVAADHPAGA